MKKSGAYPVDLGYVFNIKDTVGEPQEGVSLVIVKNRTINAKDTKQRTVRNQVTTSQEAAMTVAGSLEISAQMDVVTIKGKASVDVDNSSTEESATDAINIFVQTRSETLTLDHLSKDDFVVDIDKYSHVVTNVCYGKLLAGTMTLKSKEKSKTVDADGELSVKLADIPISGKGTVHVHDFDAWKDYNLSTQITVRGMPKTLPFEDVESFVQSTETFVSEDASNSQSVVGFTLTPLSSIKSLEVTPEDVYASSVNDETKRTLFNLAGLLSYAKILREKAVQADKEYNLHSDVKDVIGSCDQLINEAEDIRGNIAVKLGNCTTVQGCTVLSTYASKYSNYTPELLPYSNVKSHVDMNTHLATLQAAIMKKKNDVSAADIAKKENAEIAKEKADAALAKEKADTITYGNTIVLANQYKVPTYLTTSNVSTKDKGGRDVRTAGIHKFDDAFQWEVRTENNKATDGFVKYGDKIHLKSKTEHTYLDTWGGSPRNGYDVFTAPSSNRDRGSGIWQIVSVTGKDGNVKNSDKIHLINQYVDKTTYLDTWGGTTQNGYGVETSLGSDRDHGSGSWKIVHYTEAVAEAFLNGTA